MPPAAEVVVHSCVLHSPFSAEGPGHVVPDGQNLKDKNKNNFLVRCNFDGRSSKTNLFLERTPPPQTF